MRARRHGALLARGRAGLPGRRRPVDLRALPRDAAGRRAARGRRPARLDDDAVDARVQRRPRRRPRADLRAHDRRRGARRGACGARARRRTSRSPTASRAASCSARRTSRRSRSSVPTVRREGPHRRSPADFVSARRRAPASCTLASAFGEDDFRLGARAGPRRSMQPGAARRHLRRARSARYAGPLGQGRRPATSSRTCASAVCSARGDAPPRVPVLLALRHDPLIHYARPSWYIRTTALRDRLLAANNDASTGSPTHIKRRPLRRLPARTTSTGRSRASATGARRCHVWR